MLNKPRGRPKGSFKGTERHARHGKTCEHGVVQRNCVPCHGKGICEHKLQRHQCKQCGFESWANVILSAAKQRSKKRDIPFSLTRSKVEEALRLGCPVFGFPFDPSGARAMRGAATADRFNPVLGYTDENTYIVSDLVNLIKQDASAEEVLRVALWMYATEKYGHTLEPKQSIALLDVLQGQVKTVIGKNV